MTARKQNRKSATITTPTAPGATAACASSMPTARWSGQRPSRSRRTVRTLSPSCSMPVITKTMPPITRHRYRSAEVPRLCRCLAGCHKRLLSVGVYGTELGCCPTDGSGKKQNNYSAPDIDWSGYAWTQKIITAAGGKDKLNATEDSGYPATYYAVVDYAHKVPSPPTAPAGFCPPSARCGMFIKTALLCLKARQWYQA